MTFGRNRHDGDDGGRDDHEHDGDRDGRGDR